jgi:hypothetical protein
LHKVTVFAFFRRNRIPRNLVHLRFDFRAVQRFDRNRVARDHRHLPRLQEHHFACVFHDSGRIAGEKIFALAQTQHNAACISNSRRHDFIGFIRRHEHNHIRALNLMERFAGSFH